MDVYAFRETTVRNERKSELVGYYSTKYRAVIYYHYKDPDYEVICNAREVVRNDSKKP